ncbi:MAG: aldehyde ferredoxin oxidoreductase C-terminal domain-containing protein, partial [Haloferacaceae archaeon]
LSHRVMHEPIPDGPSEGMYCPPEELEAMLDEYYEFRGWDDDGVPTDDTVERLDIAADDLPGVGGAGSASSSAD